MSNEYIKSIGNNFPMFKEILATIIKHMMEREGDFLVKTTRDKSTDIAKIIDTRENKEFTFTIKELKNKKESK
jgi:hypothetical protein